MEGEIDEHVVLDYAVFHISPTENSYEAVVCSKGKTEKLATGPLVQLKLHLREASSPSDNSFKLQVAESLKGLSWFTKFTLALFLRMVNLPEVIKVASAIEDEMSQLEETRRFHLALNAKGHLNHSGDGTSDCMKEVGLPQKIKFETSSSDATKNELLHAMDSRLVTLKEELGAAFNRAAGATCSTRQISDLAEFAQHFGAIDLRNCLLTYIALISKDQPSNLPIEQSSNESKTEEIYQTVQQIDLVKPIVNGTSLAKIAQAERKSSTESEESSESSDEDRSNAERSRAVRRSAPLRRSASPMRGIQLGRSGSRRSSALAIKSLNYFPSRERTSCNRDVDRTDSGYEESDRPPKKLENPMRSMSVQDAINLFERKKKDQNPDVQKSKVLAEGSASNAKSVLRRWSAGTGDSFTDCSHEKSSDTDSHITSKNPPLESEENELTEVKAEPDSPAGSPKPVATSQFSASSEMERIASPPMDSPSELVMPKVEESNDRATASVEWSRQKEAELNQMLMKMESKAGSHRGADAGSGGHQDISSEHRGEFYSQYNEKRAAKFQAQNGRMRATKEAQFKVMQETLQQSKAGMASKMGGIMGKHDPFNYSQKPRRNSSPPVLPRKDVSKPTGPRKASPRSSPLPGGRNSPSSGPLPRRSTTPQAKPSPGTVSTNSTPNRLKPHPTLSPTKPSPRIERAVQQPKGKKGTQVDVKPSLKGQEEKQQKAPTKTGKLMKIKSPTASGDDAGMRSAKPSFYSKVTRKNSVVPLESKPFLRKGTGNNSGISPVVAKTKVPQSDDSSRNSQNLIRGEETGPTAVAAELATVELEPELVQIKGDVDTDLEAPFPLGDDINQETRENSDVSTAVVDNGFENSVGLPVAEIQPVEDVGISSAAWVEQECREVSASCYNGPSGAATSPRLASSPRVRHSLSQMLQADESEPDMIEWGNAENPPALIYQKDVSKGLKRLLKFARKSKDGKDDPEESKSASKRSSDTLLRKDVLQAKGCGPQKTALSESFDGYSKRAMDYRMSDILQARSSDKDTATLSSQKLLAGHISTTAASAKGTRSFFSLSRH